MDDEQVARQCLAACDQRIQDLEDLGFLADRTKSVAGFGDFEMADALAGGFLGQATGENNSIDQIISDHIEVVKNMREVMALSIKRLTGQDVTNAADFTAGTEGQ
ncbi:hypothetical protein [Nocardia callitridis]|uniref:hypothetical protein n=1 Tax=Nocardia callitridis TaxID=648753 RepID=UPI0031F0DAC9